MGGRGTKSRSRSFGNRQQLTAVVGWGNAACRGFRRPAALDRGCWASVTKRVVYLGSYEVIVAFFVPVRESPFVSAAACRLQGGRGTAIDTRRSQAFSVFRAHTIIDVLGEKIFAARSRRFQIHDVDGRSYPFQLRKSRASK